MWSAQHYSGYGGCDTRAGAHADEESNGDRERGGSRRGGGRRDDNGDGERGRGGEGEGDGGYDDARRDGGRGTRRVGRDDYDEGEGGDDRGGNHREGDRGPAGGGKWRDAGTRGRREGGRYADDDDDDNEASRTTQERVDHGCGRADSHGRDAHDVQPRSARRRGHDHNDDGHDEEWGPRRNHAPPPVRAKTDRGRGAEDETRRGEGPARRGDRHREHAADDDDDDDDGIGGNINGNGSSGSWWGAGRRERGRGHARASDDDDDADTRPRRGGANGSERKGNGCPGAGRPEVSRRPRDDDDDDDDDDSGQWGRRRDRNAKSRDTGPGGLGKRVSRREGIGSGNDDDDDDNDSYRHGVRSGARGRGGNDWRDASDDDGGRGNGRGRGQTWEDDDGDACRFGREAGNGWARGNGGGYARRGGEYDEEGNDGEGWRCGDARTREDARGGDVGRRGRAARRDGENDYKTPSVDGARGYKRSGNDDDGEDRDRGRGKGKRPGTTGSCTRGGSRGPTASLRERMARFSTGRAGDRGGAEVEEKEEAVDEIGELLKHRERLRREVEEREARFMGQEKNAQRRKADADHTFVWILVEGDSRNAHLFNDGFSMLPVGWKCIFFCNAMATCRPRPVMRAQVVTSLREGSHGKSKNKNSGKMPYPASDLVFTVGDIIGYATAHGIERLTTVYFVYGPHEPAAPRYQQCTEFLNRFDIVSTVVESGSEGVAEVFKREGLDPSPYALDVYVESHAQRQRTRSQGPKPKRRSISSSVGQGVY